MPRSSTMKWTKPSEVLHRSRLAKISQGFGRYICPDCPTMFTSEMKYKQHWKEVHGVKTNHTGHA